MSELSKCQGFFVLLSALSFHGSASNNCILTILTNYSWIFRQNEKNSEGLRITKYCRLPWNFLQARRIIKNVEGSYQLTKNFGHYGCLTKKNFRFKSPAMARNTFDICRVSWCEFPLYIVFFNELLKANLSFRVFQLTEGFGV